MEEKIYLASGVDGSVLYDAYDPETRIFDKTKSKMREVNVFHAATISDIAFMDKLFETGSLEVKFEQYDFGPEYYLCAAVKYAVGRSKMHTSNPVVLFLHLPDCVSDKYNYIVHPTNQGTFYEITPAIVTIDDFFRVKSFTHKDRMVTFELERFLLDL